jgi:carbon monoxide dehydrogenase subunit G
MKLEHSIDIAAPPEVAWPALLDLEQVVLCLPGAQILERLDDDAYRAAIAMRLGPMSMRYEGEIRFEEMDAAARRAVLRGRATEARGQGTAMATIGLQLSAIPEGTRADMDVDLVLSGRVAQMGGRVVQDVSSQMIAQFGDCLARKVASGAATPAGGEAPKQVEPERPPAIRPARLLMKVFVARLRRLLRLGLAK